MYSSIFLLLTTYYLLLITKYLLLLTSYLLCLLLVPHYHYNGSRSLAGCSLTKAVGPAPFGPTIATRESQSTPKSRS